MIWIAIVALLIWLAWPLRTDGLISSPHPARDYDEALKVLSGWEIQEGKLNLLDVCRTKILTHGHKTARVLLLLHGYTSCPEQYAELARRFFELGYNVLIPNMDYHGRADRLTDDLKHLTAEDLASFGDRVLDAACGLGEKVTVLGISGGGTVAAWLAQNRTDLDFAVPLAAFLRPRFLPAYMTTPFIRIFTTLPNFYLWWDPRTKAENPFSVYYAYPRYSLRTLAHIMRLGLAVKRQASAQPPSAGYILMMMNDFDPGVSNVELERLYEVWKSRKPGSVSAYHFEKDMKMLHDIITPGKPGIPTEEVYIRLIQQVTTLAEKAHHPM
jgi:carboxylesterase